MRHRGSWLSRLVALLNWSALVAGALILAICVPPLVSSRLRVGHSKRYEQQMAKLSVIGLSPPSHFVAQLTAWAWIVGGLGLGTAFFVGALLQWTI